MSLYQSPRCGIGGTNGAALALAVPVKKECAQEWRL
jgi:hypothetical protein